MGPIFVFILGISVKIYNGPFLFQSWRPKLVVRKWLNIQSGADEFHSDYAIKGKTTRRKSCSDDDYYVFVQDDFSGWMTAATTGLKQSTTLPEAPAENLNLNLKPNEIFLLLNG
ncbi:type I inositol polyphosphate 5-phosphatase 8-like [Mangifera indica]|uniref:type I inositol polyphosphate 5-phosphatase 8-like n=1 Tax=Mangifera indica TaxID=29780 RepID=UPI001CFAEA45|nr:type I inositol polyphosphate 5-phosphatase 8-like [Mangifera indica]